MKKRTKTLLIGTGAVALGMTAVGALSYTLTNYLVKIAMDREPPKVKNMDKAKEQLRGFEDVDSFYANLEKNSEKLRNCGCEMVSIRGYDGERLVGHWYPCENAQRIIIAMHGWRSSWAKDFGTISEFWHSKSCSVLYAEQRGQNNSGGEYMGFGLLERYDCQSWAQWVDKRNEAALPIYLAGASLGATTVLMTAGLDLPENVHGVIADCGFTSPHEIWKHVVQNNLHLSYGVIGKLASDICRKKIQMGTKEYSTVDAMKNSSLPVLFIHGSDDHFVPVEMTYENYEACTAPKRLLIVPGADHGMSYATDTKAYQTALKDFWNDFD